jgi:hypothetical protein
MKNQNLGRAPTQKIYFIVGVKPKKKKELGLVVEER